MTSSSKSLLTSCLSQAKQQKMQTLSPRTMNMNDGASCITIQEDQLAATTNLDQIQIREVNSRERSLNLQNQPRVHHLQSQKQKFLQQQQQDAAGRRDVSPDEEAYSKFLRVK